MPTVAWIGNAQLTAQEVTIQLTNVALDAVFTATINTKSISYTCTASDTVNTAAAAWAALLADTATVPPELNEISYSVSGDTITLTATVPGTPFYSTTWGLTATGTRTARLTLTETVPNSSPSDVFNPLNWERGATTGLPQTGDDMVVSDSAVPLLWNLDKLANVRPNSYIRWQDFTGTIGLPENNPLGYVEYRPTYFQLGGSSSSSSGSSGASTASFTMVLGQGVLGAGPSRERYQLGTQQVELFLIASGTPADDYAVRILNTNSNSVFHVQTTSLGVAMVPGELSLLGSVDVQNGGSVALGPGVTFAASGSLSLTGGSAYIDCLVGKITANGSQVFVETSGLTYASVTALAGSNINWLSSSNISNLVLQTSSNFNKLPSGKMTITNATIDGDTCTVADLYNGITWTNPVVINNQVASGPFTFGPGRTVKVV